MKKGNAERQVMTKYETKLVDKQDMKEKTHEVATHTATFPPHHTSIVPLTSTHYTWNIQTDTLLEIEANPFSLIKQTKITIIPALKRLHSRTPDKFMAILWIPGGHFISIKKNMTIYYIKD